MVQNIQPVNPDLRRIDEEIAEIRRSINACEIFLNTNRHDANDVRETTADINEYTNHLRQLEEQRQFIIAQSRKVVHQTRVKGY